MSDSMEDRARKFISTRTDWPGHSEPLTAALTAFAKEEVKRALPEAELMASHFDECAGEADDIAENTTVVFVRDSSRASATKFRCWAEALRALKEQES